MTIRKNLKGKILSLLLAVLMGVGLMSTTSMAIAAEDVSDKEEVVEEVTTTDEASDEKVEIHAADTGETSVVENDSQTEVSVLPEAAEDNDSEEETESKIKTIPDSIIDETPVLIQKTDDPTLSISDIGDGQLAYTYDEENHTATVTGLASGASASGALNIPETVSHKGDADAQSVDYTVTAIGANAFKNQTGFTGALTLPDALTIINESAFEGCAGLSGNLVLPAGLKTIGASAFQGCEGFDGSLNLPAGLTSLGKGAFQDCKYLTGDLVIPAGITNIPDNCFYNSSNSHYSDWMGYKSISFADGSQLESIGAHAFDGCAEALTGGLNFPGTLTSIGDYAFNGLGAKSSVYYWDSEHPYGDGYEGTLTLPAGIQHIGAYAFATSNFNGDLVIPNGSVTIGEYAFENAGFYNGTLKLSEGMTTVPDRAFSRCMFTGRLTLPSTLRTVGILAFECQYMDPTLVIPVGMTEIGKSAFENFASESYEEGVYGTLTLPAGLKTIGESAFYGAGFSGPLVIPDSVEEIKGESDFGAFGGCHGFTSLKLPNNPNFTTIPDHCFGNASISDWASGNLTGELVIPDNVTSIGAEAFANTKFTGELKLGANLESIGEGAFYLCQGFSGKLTIPEKVTTISKQAFYGLDVTELELHDGLTSIGEKAFFGCDQVKGDLVIPGSVKTIGREAFRQFGYKAETTGELTLSEGIETIGNDAFRSCEKFVGCARVPTSVTSLGEGVFTGCSGFTSYSLPDTLSSVPRDTFSYCSGLTGSLIVPSQATSIGSYAFQKCTGLSGALAIPEGVTSIGSSAFQGCTGLDGALSLPSSLTEIGMSAFQDCKNLAGSPNLPSGLTSLGSYAFQGCSSLKGDMTIPAGITKLSSDLFRGCTGLTGTLTIPAGTQLSYKSATPFAQTRFSTIVNNSSLTFNGPSLLIDGLCACYLDGNDNQVTDLGTGSYTLKTYDNPVDISGAAVTGIDAVYVYTGSYIKPVPTVTLNGRTLTEGTEYTVSYSDNYYNNRTAHVYVKGNGYNGYMGSVEKTFLIRKESDIVNSPDDSNNTENENGGQTGGSGSGQTTDGSTTGQTTGGSGQTTTVTQQNQTITASDITKTFGAAAFALGAKTSGDGKLTYQSSNTKVVTVGSDGKATIKGAGTAKITINAAATSKYKAASKTITVTVKKAANPLTVKGKTATVKYSKVKKKAQTLAVGKVIKFTKKGQGKMTYTKASGNKKITINKKTGKVTVKKGLKKGTYKVKVKIKAAGNANYKASKVKTVTFKVKVK